MKLSSPFLRSFALLTLLVAPLIAQDSPATAPVMFERSYPVSSNPRVSVRNISGNVDIVGWDRNEVSIVAEKRARKPEVAAKAEIAVEASADRVDIETRFEKSWLWGDKVQVDYLIKVPTGTRLELIKVVNSGVRVRGVTGQATVEAVNGNLDLAGLASGGKFQTVNGSIDIEFTAVSARDDIVIETVNGNGTLSVPADAAFSFVGKTVNGSIECGLPLEKSRSSRGDVVGTVRSGGASVTLKSINGNLRVRARP
jgi:hypothetical protein